MLIYAIHESMNIRMGVLGDIYKMLYNLIIYINYNYNYYNPRFHDAFFLRADLRNSRANEQSRQCAHSVRSISAARCPEPVGNLIHLECIQARP